MESLIVYDLEGSLISVVTGTILPKTPVGVPYLITTIPNDKMIVGVDVSKTPHEVILEDIPPSEIKVLNDKLDNALIELTTLIAMGGM